MADNLNETIEKAEVAVGTASEVLGEESLAPLVTSLRAVRARASFPDDVVVTALAGGTGSGKSSLFNALVGEDLADVGGVRPTTQSPEAAVPNGSAGRFDGYLDTIGVDRRFQHAGTGFLLIDLPDTDSLVVEHKHRVDQVLPFVDVMVWVVDPEKYRDARLHEEYLKPLAAYSRQFVFVLNQIDRLHPSDVDSVKDDLTQALLADGIVDPVILTVAASPPSGPPIDVDRLIAELEGRGASRDSVTDKLLVDMAETAKTLSTNLSGGVDFDKRASVALETAVQALVDNRDGEAIAVMIGLLDEVARGVEGPTAGRLRRLAADVPGHVSRISKEIEPPALPRRRWGRQPDPEPRDADTSRRLLSEAVIRPARALLAKRAVAVASIAELTLDLERWRQRTPR